MSCPRLQISVDDCLQLRDPTGFRIRSNPRLTEPRHRRWRCADRIRRPAFALIASASSTSRHHRFEQSEDRRYRYRFLRGLFCGVDHRAQFDDIFFMETCCMIHSRQSFLEFCVVTKFSQKKGLPPQFGTPVQDTNLLPLNNPRCVNKSGSKPTMSPSRRIRTSTYIRARYSTTSLQSASRVAVKRLMIAPGCCDARSAWRTDD